VSTVSGTAFETDAAQIPLQNRPGKLSPASVFATALVLGSLTAVIEGRGSHHELPVASWTGHASRSDRFLLDHCHGSTVDLGCGPGRLAAELQARGRDVLGVDASPSALAAARRRGVPVFCGSLFDAVPGEGTWDTALLADGNIGIGGNPALLLARARELVHTNGRIVVDLARPGTGLRVHELHLRAGGLASTSFSWAVLGPDDLADIAAAARLQVVHVTHKGGRTVGVLRARSVGTHE
jgi:SAM-dependent methyltransferase